MKHTLIYTLTILLHLQLFSQSHNKLGITSKEGLNTSINSLGNYITGTQFTNPEKRAFNSINLIGNNTGSKVKTAIYTDKNNAPDQLIASSETGTIGDGISNLLIDDVSLEAGKFWIMTIYDQDGHHLFSNHNSNQNDVFYLKNKFDDTFPKTADSFLKYQGHTFAYFLGSIDKTAITSISFYPNPAKDWLLLKNPLHQNLSIKILDRQGHTKIVANGNSELIEIDIQKLVKGNYYLIVNNTFSELLMVQ